MLFHGYQMRQASSLACTVQCCAVRCIETHPPRVVQRVTEQHSANEDPRSNKAGAKHQQDNIERHGQSSRWACNTCGTPPWCDGSAVHALPLSSNAIAHPLQVIGPPSNGADCAGLTGSDPADRACPLASDLRISRAVEAAHSAHKKCKDFPIWQ